VFKQLRAVLAPNETRGENYFATFRAGQFAAGRRSGCPEVADLWRGRSAFICGPPRLMRRRNFALFALLSAFALLRHDKRVLRGGTSSRPSVFSAASEKHLIAKQHILCQK
jgi:hypothetical protein